MASQTNVSNAESFTASEMYELLPSYCFKSCMSLRVEINDRLGRKESDSSHFVEADASEEKEQNEQPLGCIITIRYFQMTSEHVWQLLNRTILGAIAVILECGGIDRAVHNR